MLRTRLAILGFLLAIVLGVGVFIGLIVPALVGFKRAPTMSSSAVVLKQVQTLSELVTIKYVLEKVVVLEDPKWYGENRVIMVAHGIVKAGVDLSRLQPSDVHPNGKKVVIILPPAAITDVYLDDKRTEVVERTTGIMRQFDKDLEQNARRAALGSLRRAAHTQGILKEADDRAHAQLSVFFGLLGFEEVEFRKP